jgi:hypothetical protein
MAVLFYAADPTPPDPFENFTGDDFTGTNGAQLNTTNWTASTGGSFTDTFTIQNNKAFINLESTPEEALSTSNFALVGDFDIQISIDSVPAINDSIVRMLALSADSAYGCLAGFQRISGVLNFHASHKTAGVWDSQTKVARTNNYGGLRMIRTGTIVVIQYKDGAGAWTQLITKDQSNSDNMLVKLHCKAYAGSPIGANYDDFIINSGTVAAA